MNRSKSIKPTDDVPADLVTVAKFGNSMEAQLARTKLESRKIKSYVLDENMICMAPLYDIALGGVRLIVRDSDLVKATKILGLKSRGNFWVPRKLFFFTYVFSEYLLAILFILLGALLYLLRDFVIGSFDKSLFMCVNSILFGTYTFLYSEKILKNNSAWVSKWYRANLDRTAALKGVRYLGVFVFSVGIVLTFKNDFWFSAPIIFWCIFSLATWQLFFYFISNDKFAALMKKLVVSWMKMSHLRQEINE